MNAITSDYIIYVSSQVHPDNVLHPTSIAYVQSLLGPYAEAIETATTTDAISQWVPLAYQGELAKHATSEMGKAILKNPENDVAVAKIAVIEYLVAEILELAGNLTRDQQDETVVPWDIQRAIGNDEELSRMFGIASTDTKLPVIITVGPQHFNHNLSFGFVAGLLLYSHPEVGNHDFRITVFGVPFSSTYMIPTDPDRSPRFYYNENGDEGKNREYMFKVGNRQFAFDTLEFLHGFIAGPYWDNVDHHKFWHDLKHNDPDKDEPVPMTF